LLEPLSALTRSLPYKALSDGDTKMQGTESGQGFWTLLSRDERDTLWRLGLPRDYPAGATICLEGDPATHVYILLAGWVKILSATKDGQAIVLALRSAGDIVGEVAGETTGHRNATIQAVDAVRTLIVRHDKFSAFLDSNQGADRAYRRVVTQKWTDTDTMLRRRAGTTGAQRLAALLLDLAERHGRTVNGTIHLMTPSLSQEELASLAGTSRATVTRAFGNWRKRGLIRTGQRRITIIDLPGLRQVAGQRR
jgi:CRP/FNR family transcriptional regulator, cyclic AMP receptor protein